MTLTLLAVVAQATGLTAYTLQQLRTSLMILPTGQLYNYYLVPVL